MVNNEIIKLKFDNSFNGRLFATQGDTGRVFNLQVFDDYNKPVDVTGMKLRMYVANSKEVSYSEGEIVEDVEGKIKVQVYNSQLKYPGKQKTQFILTDKDGQKIGSKIFDLWIEEGLEAGPTVGRNIYVDFEKINEALDLIKDYDKTLEEAKEVDASLKVGINEGIEARNNLADCKKKALEIKDQLDKSKVDANKTLDDLKTTKTESETLKSDLSLENQKATENFNGLNTKIEEGKTTTSELNTNIENAKTNKSNLDKSNTTALSTKKSLEDVTNTANTTKTELGSLKNQSDTLSKDLSSKITDGKNLKSSLDSSISNAATAKSNLDERITNAASANTTLKATDTEAKKTEALIRNLMNQLGKTENEVKQIIASGDLSQYVTDPKLQEVLKSYATKEDLSGIDVTGQLVDYAKKTQVPTKLSQLTNDKTYKTESEIQAMINNSTKLKKEVVTSLPSTGKEDIIYLLKNKNDNNNFYTEYLWIGGKWEIIGDTKVDLTDYAKKSDIKTKLSEMVEDSTHRVVTDTEKTTWNNKVDKINGKSLSSNDFTNEAKGKVDAIPSNPKYTDTITRIAGKTGDITKEDLEGLGLGGISEDEAAAISLKLIYTDYLFSDAKDLYNKLNLASGTNFSPTIKTTDNLVNSDVATKELINNKLAWGWALKSISFIDKMSGSSTAMNAVANSSTAMNALHTKAKNFNKNKTYKGLYIITKTSGANNSVYYAKTTDGVNRGLNDYQGLYTFTKQYKMAVIEMKPDYDSSDECYAYIIKGDQP